MSEEVTVLQVLEQVKIPLIYQDNLDNYPHVKEFFTILKKGKTQNALRFYEFFINRKEFYLDKSGIINARTKRGNRRNRQRYGSNWSKKMNSYLKPSLYKIQNGMCKKCFKWFSMASLEVDHINRVADGGKVSDLRNLQLLCVSCHDEKDNYKKGNDIGFITGKRGTPWAI